MIPYLFNMARVTEAVPFSLGIGWLNQSAQMTYSSTALTARASTNSHLSESGRLRRGSQDCIMALV